MKEVNGAGYDTRIEDVPRDFTQPRKGVKKTMWSDNKKRTAYRLYKHGGVKAVMKEFEVNEGVAYYLMEKGRELVEDKWEHNRVAKKIKHNNTQSKEAANNAKDFKNLDRKGYLEGDIPTVGMFVSGFLLGFSVALLFIHLLLIQVL